MFFCLLYWQICDSRVSCKTNLVWWTKLKFFRWPGICKTNVLSLWGLFWSPQTPEKKNNLEKIATKSTNSCLLTSAICCLVLGRYSVQWVCQRFYEQLLEITFVKLNPKHEISIHKAKQQVNRCCKTLWSRGGMYNQDNK